VGQAVLHTVYSRRPAVGVASPVHRARLLRWLGREYRELGRDPGRFDPAAVDDALQRIGWLFGDGCYFGLEVRGWEHLPPAPVMVVSNHSGGTTIPDVWGFACAWYRQLGRQRPLHVLAHDMLFASRATGRYFSRMGVLRADRAIAASVLSEYRRDLMVMPGGDVDTWRPYRKRYRVCFGGRVGYARAALAAGVPIVPVAHDGAHSTLLVLSDGRRLAHALRLPALTRASVFPIHLSLPWGLAIGPLPHLPVPARLRYRIGAPIWPPVPDVPGQAPAATAVAELDRQVRAAVQGLLDELRDD
jgi:1-acyl-sn-glycerol-3-phosphate acyltransferase